MSRLVVVPLFLFCCPVFRGTGPDNSKTDRDKLTFVFIHCKNTVVSGYVFQEKVDVFKYSYDIYSYMKAGMLTDWVHKDRRKMEAHFARDVLKNGGFLLFTSHLSFGSLPSKYFLYDKNNIEFKVFQSLVMLFLNFKYYKIEVLSLMSDLMNR